MPIEVPRSCATGLSGRSRGSAWAATAFASKCSNEYGQDPLVIGAAHVALAGEGSVIVAGSDRPLTFGGEACRRAPQFRAIRWTWRCLP